MGGGRERGRGSQRKLGSGAEGGQVCSWTRSPHSSRIFEGLGAVFWCLQEGGKSATPGSEEAPCHRGRDGTYVKL